MSNSIIDIIEKESIRTDLPAFNIGDTIRVSFKFKEITKATNSPGGSKNNRQAAGVKEEIKHQSFEGIVIARKNGGCRETVTVRKISSGIGVEKTFCINSPQVDGIKVVKRGRVRRAKLYYLRDRSGKAAKVPAAKITAKPAK